MYFMAILILEGRRKNLGISENLVTHYHLCWGAYKHSLRNKNIKVISVKDITNERNKKLKIHKYLPEEKAYCVVMFMY